MNAPAAAEGSVEDEQWKIGRGLSSLSCKEGITWQYVPVKVLKSLPWPKVTSQMTGIWSS